MDTNIFRKESLEQLSNPDQLDVVLKITKPASWVSLIALGLIILIALIWGIFGSIPYKVEGTGIILNSKGILTVVASGDGQVTEINVKEGDIIDAGQVIGKVSNAQLLQQYNNARENYREQKENADLSRNTDSEGYRIDLMNIQSQIKTTQFNLNILRQQLKNQEKIVEEQERLLAQDLITQQSLLNSKNTYSEIQKDIITAEGTLKQLRGNEITARNNLSKSKVLTDADLLESEGQLKLLETELNISENIVSPYKGKVVEVLSNEGAGVENGSVVLTLEALDGEKEAIVFVPTTMGKKLEPGMDVDISPSTVEEEEYGFIRGKVLSVSEYPATTAQMMEILGNESLVNELSEGGAPFVVSVELIRDENTYSGYKWSTQEGPQTKIGIGTVCSGSVVTREVAPISLIIPLFKKLAGF